MRSIFTDLILKITALLAFIVASNTVFAQEQVAVPGVVSQLTLNSQGEIKCELHAHDAVAQEHHRSAQNARFENAKKKKSKKKGNKGAIINISILNADPDFTQAGEATAAFASAIEIWSSNIQSDVPIEVLLIFQQLGDGVLGSAGPTQIYANFEGGQRDTWYGNALADKLAGEDLNPEVFDIVARFSTVFPNWYFGTDGNTPANDFDFRTVVLHELCHGLGFFGSMFVDNATGIGDWGFGIPDPVFPAIYDRYVYDRPGKKLIQKFPNFSMELGDVLLDDPLVFRGPNTVGVTKGKGAKIFTVLSSEDLGREIPGTTDVWLPGSSYSHVDFLTYSGTENGLMVPFLSRGLAYDEPGPIVNAIFNDTGWNGKVRKPFVDTENARLITELTPPVNIYPSEVQNQFVLDLGGEGFVLRNAQLVDVLGRIQPLTFAERNSRYIDFDLSSSATKSGIYFLQLEFDNRNAEVLRLAKVE